MEKGERIIAAFRLLWLSAWGFIPWRDSCVPKHELGNEIRVSIIHYPLFITHYSLFTIHCSLSSRRIHMRISGF